MSVLVENQGKERIVEIVWIYCHTSTPLSVTFTNLIVIILRPDFVSAEAKKLLRINHFDETRKVYP